VVASQLETDQSQARTTTGQLPSGRRPCDPANLPGSLPLRLALAPGRCAPGVAVNQLAGGTPAGTSQTIFLAVCRDTPAGHVPATAMRCIGRSNSGRFQAVRPAVAVGSFQAAHAGRGSQLSPGGAARGAPRKKKSQFR